MLHMPSSESAPPFAGFHAELADPSSPLRAALAAAYRRGDPG